MLKRVAICVLIFFAGLAALGLVDRASLLFAPCSEYGSPDSNEKRANQYNCSIREGIIVAGAERLIEVPPEVWTALATIAVAFFTLTLWRSTDKLWHAGERQLRTSRQIAALQARQTRSAIKEASRSADAPCKLPEL
jgi:hypothetical protein